MLASVRLNDYRYGFNGQEKDDELKGGGNSYDFGARIYDSRLGRFLSMDPMLTIQVGYSPYLFAGNKPIAAIDALGRLEIIITETRKGLFTTRVKIHPPLHVDTFEEVQGIRRTTMNISITTTPGIVRMFSKSHNIVGEYEFLYYSTLKKRRWFRR